MSFHPVYPPLAERIASRVKVDGECWVYMGGRDEFGYGRLKDSGTKRNVLAHRAAWQIANGPIPAGLCVLHTCDNPPCVNPAHLWLGTVGDNNRDRHAKGRTHTAIGVRNRGAVLTEEQVREIRLWYDRGAEGKSIAQVLGVSTSVVSQIGTRKTWRHLP